MAISKIVRAAESPPGSMLFRCTNVTPFGYLACDGSTVNSEQYPALSLAMGVTPGAGITFDLPNMTDRVPVGAGSIAALRGNAGSATAATSGHALTTAEMPSHSHAVTGSPAQESEIGDGTYVLDPNGGTVDNSNSAGSGNEHDHGTVSTVQPSYGVACFIKY